MIPSIQVTRFSSINHGKHLVILGSVHGNETCGTIAINNILSKPENIRSSIISGSVTFVPKCNPLAYELKARYVDHNLNRDLRPRGEPKDYEDSLANILCPILESCDVLLDLHSYHSGGPAFIFAGPDSPEEIAFRRCLGPTVEIFGWGEAYARILGKTKNDRTSIGTTEYTRLHGGIALTLECGYHDDPESVNVATRAIHNALFHCEICKFSDEPLTFFPLKLRVRLQDVFWRKDEGRLAKNWEHLETVSANEPLAFMENGAPITAPTNGRILLPHHACPVGDEWFYFGTEE